MRPDTSLPLVFVKHLAESDSKIPKLGKTDLHHLEKVLRVRNGERICISDGKGSWQECAFGDSLEDFGNIQTQAQDQNRRKLGIAFCPLKSGKSDMVISKLTEVGIDYMTPFFSERSIVEFDENKLANQTERWERIIRESAMQCKRVNLPEITYPDEFIGLSERNNVGHCVIDGEQNEKYTKEATLEPHEISLLLVGPEGGWADGEYDYICNPVNLAPNVLRSDTAAIIAGNYLVSMWDNAGN